MENTPNTKETKEADSFKTASLLILAVFIFVSFVSFLVAKFTFANTFQQQLQTLDARYLSKIQTLTDQVTDLEVKFSIARDTLGYICSSYKECRAFEQKLIEDARK